MSRTVVITGVAGGIGRATAELFLKDGWHVVGTDRAADPGDLHVDDYLRLDVADADAASRELRAIGQQLSVHALVNNAAVSLDRSLIETTVDDWDAVMAVNVRAGFVATKALLSSLEASKGSIVNISSVHALATSRNVAVYAASKGALLALTRAAAVELAEHGIRVNAVLPGATDTPMLRKGLGLRGAGSQEAGLRKLKARTPLGRIASPREISEAVLFLADENRSGFITGQALVVDGGATSRLSTE